MFSLTDALSLKSIRNINTLNTFTVQVAKKKKKWFYNHNYMAFFKNRASYSENNI